MHCFRLAGWDEYCGILLQPQPDSAGQASFVIRYDRFGKTVGHVLHVGNSLHFARSLEKLTAEFTELVVQARS
jgi:hypothetical protein